MKFFGRNRKVTVTPPDGRTMDLSSYIGSILVSAGLEIQAPDFLLAALGKWEIGDILYPWEAQEYGLDPIKMWEVCAIQPSALTVLGATPDHTSCCAYKIRPAGRLRDDQIENAAASVLRTLEATDG